MSDSDFLGRYAADLADLDRKNRLRALSARAGLDFTSNDYLGLAASRRLADAVGAALAAGTPVGATGSRLLRGNDPQHEVLETAAAKFFGAERALFFGSGYIANFAVLTTLPRKGDLVLLDALIHASAHEGARAGRASVTTAAHNDADGVDKAIRAWRGAGNTGRAWIVVESLYSMDGDRAPLDDLIAIADRHDAFLFVDEAHATGVYGPNGRGLAHGIEGRHNVLTLHTCGKALGASGALLIVPGTIADYLVNRCRPFIYATAPSPLMAAATMEALAILREDPERRERLARLVAHANREAQARCGVKPSNSQILPVIVGDDGQAMTLAKALRTRGFDVRGIRPPTVPEGSARLRISLTLNVDEDDVSNLFEVLAEEWARIVI